MRNEPGVYALVMRLAADRRIPVGGFGEFDFPAGWYVYLGSAHGGGGVRERTNRHKREEKKNHWHVDYLRPYAPISEIWFSHSSRVREHDWAWILCRMKSAMVPVPKFGAKDCRAGCAAHLFHFDHHPSTAVFRSDLAPRFPKHAPVFVEFVEPRPDAGAAPNHADGALLASYHRGRRYLEARRRAHYDGLEEVHVESPPTDFSKKSLGRQIVRKLAEEANLSEEGLMADAKFAAAVETIISNCGDVDEEAFRVLFGLDEGRHPQTRDAIMKLSRTADARQRYRIEGVAEGRMRSVAPQSTDFHHIYDTVAFKEVPSRLWRARGAIEKLHRSLGKADPSEAEEVRCLVQYCREAALRLRSFVRNGSKEAIIPQSLSKERVVPVLRCRDVRGEVVGLARLALSLTIKSIWDYPEMQRRGLVASEKERGRTLEELDRVVAAADAILSLLGDEAS